MEGIVLHFDADKASGLIRSTDGNRYSFEATQWRSPGQPGSGDRIDFDLADGQAVEIYILEASRQAGLAAPARENPAAPGAASYLSQRPGLIPAALIVLSCFLPFVSAGFISANLFGVISFVSGMLRVASSLASSCIYLLYVIPAAAAWLAFREFRGDATPGLRLWIGLIGLLGPFGVFMLSAMILASGRGRSAPSAPFGAPPPSSSIGAQDISNLLSAMGAGWFLLIAASLALIWSGAAAAWAEADHPPPAAIHNSPAQDTLPTDNLASVGSDAIGFDTNYHNTDPYLDDRGLLKFNIARIALAGTLLFAVFPWIVITTSDGLPVGTASAFDLAKGNVQLIFPSLGFSGSIGKQWSVVIAMLLVVSALAASFMLKKGKAAIAILAASGVSIALLLLGLFNGLPRSIEISGVSRAVSSSPMNGFLLTLVALGTAMIASGFFLTDHEDVDETL